MFYYWTTNKCTKIILKSVMILTIFSLYCYLSAGVHLYTLQHIILIMKTILPDKQRNQLFIFHSPNEKLMFSVDDIIKSIYMQIMKFWDFCCKFYCSCISFLYIVAVMVKSNVRAFIGNYQGYRVSKFYDNGNFWLRSLCLPLKVVRIYFRSKSSVL